MQLSAGWPLITMHLFVPARRFGALLSGDECTWSTDQDEAYLDSKWVWKVEIAFAGILLPLATDLDGQVSAAKSWIAMRLF